MDRTGAFINARWLSHPDAESLEINLRAKPPVQDGHPPYNLRIKDVTPTCLSSCEPAGNKSLKFVLMGIEFKQWLIKSHHPLYSVSSEDMLISEIKKESR